MWNPNSCGLTLYLTFLIIVNFYTGFQAPGPCPTNEISPRVLDETRQSSCIGEEPTSEQKQRSGALSKPGLLT